MFKTRKHKARKPTLADFFADGGRSIQNTRPTEATKAPDENVATTIASVAIINS